MSCVNKKRRVSTKTKQFSSSNRLAQVRRVRAESEVRSIRSSKSYSNLEHHYLE